MRIKAIVGHRMLLVPVTDEAQTFEWLLDECIRRAGVPDLFTPHKDISSTNTAATKTHSIDITTKTITEPSVDNPNVDGSATEDSKESVEVDLDEWCLYTSHGYELFPTDRVMDVLDKDDEVMLMRKGGKMETSLDQMRATGLDKAAHTSAPDEGVYGVGTNSINLQNLGNLNNFSNLHQTTNLNNNNNMNSISTQGSMGVPINSSTTASLVSNEGSVYAEHLAGTNSFVNTHAHTGSLNTANDTARGELYDVEQLIKDLQSKGYEMPESVGEIHDSLNDLTLPPASRSQTHSQSQSQNNLNTLVPPLHSTGSLGKSNNNTFGTPLSSLRTPLSSQPSIYTGLEASQHNLDSIPTEVSNAGVTGQYTNAQLPMHSQDRPQRPRRKPFRILLVRHGVSTANLDPSVYEYTPDHRIPLAPEGKTMARKAGEAISKYFYEVFKDPSNAGHIRMWHSPYLRAVETAEAIRDSCGQWISDARENPMIAEIDYGLFEGRGRTFAQDLGMQKELTHYNLRAMHSGRFWARFPLGESPFDVCQRVAMFNGTIVRDRDNRANNKPPIDTIIVVSHGITLRVFMKMWCHRSLDWYENEWNGNNCSVRLVTSSGDNGYMFNGFDAHDCTVEAPGPSSYSKSRTQTAKKELKKRQGSIVLNRADLPSSPVRNRKGSTQHLNTMARTNSREKKADHLAHSTSNSIGNLDDISECNDTVSPTSPPETPLEKELGSSLDSPNMSRSASVQSFGSTARRTSSLPGLTERAKALNEVGFRCTETNDLCKINTDQVGIVIDEFSNSNSESCSDSDGVIRGYRRVKSHQERKNGSTLNCDLLLAASEMLPPDSDVEIRYDGSGNEDRDDSD